jgi:hypothetical protein
VTGFPRVLSYQVAGAVEAGELVVVLKKSEAEPLPASLCAGAPSHRQAASVPGFCNAEISRATSVALAFMNARRAARQVP